MATITVDALTVAIGTNFYNFVNPTTLALVEGANIIFATASGIQVSSGAVVASETTLLLYQITVANGIIVGTVDLRQFGGIDVSQFATGNLPLGNNSVAVQNTVQPGGGINLGSSLNTGTVPYSGLPIQVTSTINPALDPSSGSFVGQNTVGTTQIQETSVISKSVYQTIYDTSWLANQVISATSFQWYWKQGAVGVGPTTSLPTGSSLVYDVHSNTDTGSRGISSETLTIAANATITLEFDHANLVTGAQGINSVAFVGGSVSTGPNTLNTVTVNAADLPVITSTTNPNPTNTLEALSLGTFTSTPTITQVPNTTYSVNEHSGGASGPFTSVATATPIPGSQWGSKVNGPWVYVTTFPAATFPPTGESTQISIDVSGITGSGLDVLLQLSNPTNNTALADWTVTSNSPQTLTYFAAGATGGAYLLFMSAQWPVGVGRSSPAPPGNYPASVSFSGTTWYQNDATTTYTYPTTAGAAQSFHSPTPGGVSAALAPTTAATQVSLTIATLSDANVNGNVSGLFVTLTDPNGTVVDSAAIAGVGTTSFWVSTASGGGPYVWTLYGYVATNAGNQSASLPVTVTGSISWHQMVNNPIITYVSTSGAIGTPPTQTPQATVAPATAATQLTFNINSLVAPANAAGACYVVTYLLSPTGIPLVFQYSFNGGTTWTNVTTNSTVFGVAYPIGTVTTPVLYRYFNASASGGVYTWVTFGYAVPTKNGVSSYSVSWNASYGYYLPGVSGGNVYILAADGVTQLSATNNNNVDFVLVQPGACSFNVTNSAASALTFTVAVEAMGL